MNIKIPDIRGWYEAHMSTRKTRTCGESAARDWLLILGTSTLVTLGLFVLSGYLFFMIRQNPSAHSAGTAAESVMLNRSELAEVVELYRARTVRFETLRREPEPVPGPGAVRGGAPAAATTTRPTAEPPSTGPIVPMQ